MSHAWSASGTLRGFRPCTAIMLQVSQQIGRYSKISGRLARLELRPQPCHLIGRVGVEAISSQHEDTIVGYESIHHCIYIDDQRNRRSDLYRNLSRSMLHILAAQRHERANGVPLMKVR